MEPETIEPTYTLDDEAATALSRLAKRWSVSPSEALRRALSEAAGSDSVAPNSALDALHLLRNSLKERGVDFDQWEREARAIRDNPGSG